MNNVFEVPSKMFEPGIGMVDEEDVAAAGWYIYEEDIPAGLAALFPPARDLQAKLYLEHPKCEGYDSEAPFTAELDVMTVDAGERVHLVVAKRKLALGHLWSNKQRRDGIRLAPNFNFLPAEGTYEDVCERVLLYFLNGVLRTPPKLTIRWDETGLVALVNFGNTYLSTREHQVAKETAE